MTHGYVYQQFGVWWLFVEGARPTPIHLSGPYRSREEGEAALLLFGARSEEVALQTAS